ncbi:unnamed protein product [Cylicocyclus nassatus]|uniref:HAT C-terminal dimerisation domain-containing protein n=1 Tax=Cylicocyclus nassatus TaxID=53992 RepID=A0AA36HC59_CYLNA|nr:unnamed protein product [Cylicocyclus nassatus]
MIEFNGDFENGFVDYVPTKANFFNRGCPSYFIMEADVVDPNLRQQQIMDPIEVEVLNQFCNIPDLKDSMIRFYNAIPASVQRFAKWESNFREHSDSLSFYRTLLQYSNSLHVPDEVQQAIKCVLILPASNADPERSISAANRLSREERSNIKTESLDNIMTVQRNGPSILTVKLLQLALQWMHPVPGRGLDPGMPSNLAREGSLMKAVKENIAKGDAYELAKLHVRRHMAVHGLNARKDTEEIKNRLLQKELAKMNIFSIGSSKKTD